ncbi:MAG: M48 family metallopeptidase [Candidatus Latescibacteria bacterium]|nr:M48 family metallopeptidase [Candidatus Latescibacterota bacterium]
MKLGTKFAAEIEAKEKIHPDRRLQAYIQRVATPLIKNALQDRPNIEYNIKVIDDPKQINAFAVPGGFLYVYSGLLLIAEDEAEIAGILAHEIGHIVGRHSANQLAAQFGMDLLVGITLGEDPLQLGQIAGQLSGARFSRDDENEADRYGVKYTVAADYDPRGLIDFFAKLKQMKNSRSSDLEKLFASHPPTGERIKHIEKLMLKYGVEGGERHRKRFLQATAGLRRAHSSAHSGYGRK